VASIMMRDMIARMANSVQVPEDMSRRDSPPDLNRLVEDQHTAAVGPEIR